ncbi:unnamed protein product [Prorocentrum cordatum]|uniref:Uncharacterized protein n=1 Tax=Prorocentrum cordatum TaxID=2364126 RepID=A0ABN9WEE2_9DINO|nr:unnamed protein product [Polarella glacialis]
MHLPKLEEGFVEPRSWTNSFSRNSLWRFCDIILSIILLRFLVFVGVIGLVGGSPGNRGRSRMSVRLRIAGLVDGHAKSRTLWTSRVPTTYTRALDCGMP